MKPARPIVAVVGATASGKSEFAESLAEKIDGEILNADSQQFYRGFDIGTGKVPPERRRVPHWLLDLCEPGQRMTAMEFSRCAEATIGELQARGKVPILVGGTGLYLKALLEGLDELPPRDPELRLRLQEEFRSQGGEDLHRRLQALDPALAERVRPEDPLRLVRYLEIAQLTGRPPSQLMRRQRPAVLRFPTQTYWIQPDRETLRRRISARVLAMLEAGWLEEVRALVATGWNPRALENRPIGYSELAEVLEGRDLGEVRDLIILRTQQYAKRQDTFFRGMLAHPAYQKGASKLTRIETVYPQAITGF